MLCPKCETKTKVLDTRNNGQHRRRECMNKACGHRFITTEVVVAEKPPESKRGQAYVTQRADLKPKPARIEQPAPVKTTINPALNTRESLGATATDKTKLHDSFSFALRMPPGAAARLGK